MTVKKALEQLKALGNEKVRARNAKNGASDNQFGAKLGDIRALAEKIGPDHELALALWETGNIDAQLLLTLLIKPNWESTGIIRCRRGAPHPSRRSGSTRW
jgi:3-methyladenine DNA glycosylase AlkD